MLVNWGFSGSASLIALILMILSLVVFPATLILTVTLFVYLALNALVLPFSFLESIYNAIKNASGKPEAAFV
jgi:hypothetical protein